MADAAVSPNLMAYLFVRDVIQQSLRLGLVGVWDHTYPELIEALDLLNTQYPTLIQSFLPLNK